MEGIEKEDATDAHGYNRIGGLSLEPEVPKSVSSGECWYVMDDD